MNREKLIKRIRNLLDMAADVGSPNEAAIAARRAASLMRRYNIEYADTLLRDLTADDIVQGTAGKTYRTHPAWSQNLAIGVARYTDTQVRYAYTRNGRRMMNFQGHRDDLDIARYLYVYLCRAVERLADKYPDTDRVARNNFRLGVVAAVSERMAADKRDGDAQVRRHGTAVALYDAKKLALAKKFGVAPYKRRRSAACYDENARRAGEAAGRRVPLNKGIAMNAQQEKLT